MYNTIDDEEKIIRDIIDIKLAKIKHMMRKNIFGK
jgi:hypothetical protein